MKNHSKREKKQSYYTAGELNRLIDSLLYPLFEGSPTHIITDTILHSLVEQNIPETIQKFIKYNLSNVIGEITRRKK
jgi:hypothetical protein